MRRPLHLLLILVTLWRGLVGDVMAASMADVVLPTPVAVAASRFADAIASMPCHEEARAQSADLQAFDDTPCGQCAACATCHMGVLLSLALTAPTVALPSASVQSVIVAWHSAELLPVVKPPIS